MDMNLTASLTTRQKASSCEHLVILKARVSEGAKPKQSGEGWGLSRGGAFPKRDTTQDIFSNLTTTKKRRHAENIISGLTRHMYLPGVLDTKARMRGRRPT